MSQVKTKLWDGEEPDGPANPDNVGYPDDEPDDEPKDYDEYEENYYGGLSNTPPGYDLEGNMNNHGEGF